MARRTATASRVKHSDQSLNSFAIPAACRRKRSSGGDFATSRKKLTDFAQ
jgi:hypothetical protein